MVVSVTENKENEDLGESASQHHRPTKLFDRFVKAQSCKQVFVEFHDLCQAIEITYPPSQSSNDHCTFYPRLKKRLADNWKSTSLWKKLDKRFYGKEYFVDPKASLPDGKRIGEKHKVMIIGAGPCGLRTAIEMACLGCKAVVLEKRDNFSRNNILHLWPFIITDLKSLGAKMFHGKFCAGAIDHISIRQLQLILLKITLLLGVEVVLNVSFDHLSLPTDSVILEGGDTCQKGWSAAVTPSSHPISNFEFDVIVGADGKRNTLQGFKRKEFRGKLAIGLTVNFINRHTTAEAKVQEISGVAYIFNQQFFKELRGSTNIDLENIVYYKGETHYFVMTAKKHSLITKGVLKQDYDDTERLLCYANVDQDALREYALEAADFSTNHMLPNLQFAINQYGQPDIALFDFTCMYAAVNAALFREVKGRKLLTCLVGDSLLEPFWPMGTGCARGFLAAFDLVWMVRRICLKRQARNNNNSGDDNTIELEALAERESVYRLLHHSTPQNTAKDWAKYTINPSTRYMNLNSMKVTVKQVRSFYISDKDHHQFDGDEMDVDVFRDDSGETPMMVDQDDREKTHHHLNSALTRKVSIVRSNKLLTWCRHITSEYPNVFIKDMSSSWRNGLALTAIIHQFRPDLISWDDLDPEEFEKNNQMAFDIAESYFGISPVMTGREMATCQEVDKLVMVTYISQFYEVFKNEQPATRHHGNGDGPAEPLEVPKSPFSSTSPVGLLVRFTNHIKRKPEKNKRDDPPKKKKLGLFKRRGSSSNPDQEEDKENERNVASDPQTMRIGETDVKLRAKEPQNPAATKPGVNTQRTSNRISALSSQLIAQFELNSPLARPAPKPAKQLSMGEDQLSDKCYFCEKRIYIVERMSAEGIFFHRQCFVCCHCGVTLRKGNYEFYSETGKFYCRAHYAAHSGAYKLLPEKSKDNSDQGVRRKASDSLAVLSSDGVKLRHPSLAEGSHRTPERIELENIRMSMLNQPERELSEEALNQINLSLPDQIRELDDVDELLSESSDEDVDWEGMLREAKERGENDLEESDEESSDRSASESSSRDEADYSNMSTLRRPLTPVKEENSDVIDQNEVGIAVNQSGSSSESQSDDSSSSMADVDLGSEGEFPAKPVATPRTSIRTKKPSTLPRLCRPSKFSLMESDAKFQQMFEGVQMSNGKQESSHEAQECIFLSVAEIELQRQQLSAASPVQCSISYLPKNELNLLNNEQTNDLQNTSAHEAIHNWLSGCMGLQNGETPSPACLSNGSSKLPEMESTSSLSQGDSNDTTISMSSASTTSQDKQSRDKKQIEDDVRSAEQVKDQDPNFRKESQTGLSSPSTPSPTIPDVDNEVERKEKIDDVTQEKSPDATQEKESGDVTEQVKTTSDVEQEEKSFPVKKPRTVFNLLSDPPEEKQEDENHQNEERNPFKETHPPAPELKEDEEPPKEEDEGNPFKEQVIHRDRMMQRGDTMDRVHQYILHNPVGVEGVLEEDEILSSGNSECDDVELSSASSTSASELNTAQLDVTELLEDTSNQRSSIPSTLILASASEEKKISDSPIRTLAKQTPVDSILLQASARNNTSVWTNLPDVTTTSDPEVNPAGISFSESFISAYHPIQENPPAERRTSFNSLERKQKSRLQERNSWFKSPAEVAKDPPALAESDVMNLPAKPLFHMDEHDDVEPSAPPRTPDVRIVESSPLVDSLLTPTAPPKTPGFDSDGDLFFTPCAPTPQMTSGQNLPTSPSETRGLPRMDELRISAEEQPISNDDVVSSNANVTKPVVLLRQLPPTPPGSLNRRSLPALPKIAHLEALSPTGSPQSPQATKLTVEEELRARELRVKDRVEKLKAETIKRRNSKSDATKSSSSLDEVDSKPKPFNTTDHAPSSNQSASCEPTNSESSPGVRRKDSIRQKFRRMHKKKEISPPMVHKIRRVLPVPNLADENLDVTSAFVSSKEKKKRGKLKKSKRVESSATTGSGTDNSATKVNSFKGKSLFRISPKKKGRRKRSSKEADDVDGISADIQRKYPSQSDRERAVLRGERLRLLPDIPSEELSSRRPRERSDTLDSSDQFDHPNNRRSNKRRGGTGGTGFTAEEIDAKITRRVQIAARRQAKMEAQKRLRRAQVIQRQLEEVEVKQRELEERGVILEKILREDREVEQRDDSHCMHEWFQLVQEKNALLRYENELMIYQRELQLEDVQSHLQQELRERMAMDDTRKTSAQLAQEKEILKKMLDVVEQRDELVGLLEEQRLKEKDELVDMETLMLSKFDTFTQDAPEEEEEEEQSSHSPSPLQSATSS